MTSFPLNTAVLFLVFNRPDTTSQVFETIRQAKPPRLYVASDGAREGQEGEREKVDAVRKIATNVDWPCEVKTLFRKENLGCKYAPIEGISWFFEHEDQGIILEDDCVPSQSFFRFCEESLNKYRNDLRVWHVSGTNAFPKSFAPFKSSYNFSYYGSIWGWATWRNRWEHFDSELVHPQGSGLWRYALSIFEKEECPELRLAQFERIVNGLDAWDYQWFYTRAVNSGLSIVPSVNLVENIGFGEDATHTFSSGPQSYLQSHEIEFPLISPPCVVRDKARDIEYVKRFVRPPLKQRIKMQLYSFLKQLKLKSGKG